MLTASALETAAVIVCSILTSLCGAETIPVEERENLLRRNAMQPYHSSAEVGS